MSRLVHSFQLIQQTVLLSFDVILSLHLRHPPAFQTDQYHARSDMKTLLSLRHEFTVLSISRSEDLAQAYFQQNIILFTCSFATLPISPEMLFPEQLSSGALQEHLFQESHEAQALCIYSKPFCFNSHYIC